MNINPTNLNRPEPVSPPNEIITVKKGDDYRKTAELLADENPVLIEDQFPTGLAVLSELKKHIMGKSTEGDFREYRERRSKFHSASNLLLVPIQNHKIALRKSPNIGWLSKLYPNVDSFHLPFPKVQGLNSSWQWYKNGIKYPGVKKKIHPYYGAYFPTRKDHLYLFDYWLRKYRGSKKTALDMGTGCGILAFQMLTKGFESVTGTDINPNSILSARESAESLGYSDKMKIIHSNLFENVNGLFDLIVFNPPWLPAEESSEGLDQAIYYDPSMFDSFFSEAGAYLKKEGKVAFIFSNLGLKEGVSRTHPVEDELQKERFKKVKQIRRKADRSSQKTKRRDHRKDEYVELWELEKV